MLPRVRVPLAEPEAVLLSSEDAPAREAAWQGGDAAGACHELIFVSSADGEDVRRCRASLVTCTWSTRLEADRSRH